MRFATRYILTGLFFWSVFSSGLNAAQEVAGIQSGVWRRDKSPYLVTNHILIPRGLVLKIEEGVVVKFAGSYQIIVEGALIASGTKGKPIIFTSIFDSEVGRSAVAKHRSPQPSDWNGIEFLAACDDYLSVLNFCVVRYSQWGIRCLGCHPLMVNLVLAENEQRILKINDKDYPYELGKLISPINESARVGLQALPEPGPELGVTKAKR